MILFYFKKKKTNNYIMIYLNKITYLNIINDLYYIK